MDLDELFSVPPKDFVAERNRLAQRLRGAEAAEVRALKRPTASVWLVNRLWRDERGAMESLLELGGAMRAAQAKGPAKLAALEKARAEALDALRRRAVALLSENGLAASPAVLRRFETNVRTLSATGSFAPDEPGRMTHDREDVGFEAAFGAPLPDARADAGAASKRKAEAASRREEASKRKPEAASRREEASKRKPEAASRREEASNRKAAAASRREEASNRKAEAARRRAEERRIAAAEKALAKLRGERDRLRRELSAIEAEIATSERELRRR